MLRGERGERVGAVVADVAADDGPAALAGLAQAIEIDRLVRAVERAEAEMQQRMARVGERRDIVHRAPAQAGAVATLRPLRSNRWNDPGTMSSPTASPGCSSLRSFCRATSWTPPFARPPAAATLA